MIRKNTRRTATFIVAILLFIAPLTLSSTALADGYSSDQDPVRSGLWQAYNMIFGNGSGSSPDANSSDTSTNGNNVSTPITPETSTGTSPVPQNRSIYVALGDSIAAGLGLHTMANPTQFDTQCGRSSQAYSVVVAKSVELPVVNVACSGATADDLYTKQAVRGPNIPAQLTTAYAAGKPQLITITAGANDAHWSSFIKDCYAYNCATKTYTLAANAYLIALQTKLYVAFEAVKEKSGYTPPPTYITGYYNPTSTDCSDLQTAITPTELTWIAAETSALNQTIKQVADNYKFVHFVPIDFTGHDICSNDSWIQGTGDAAPFHPTITGQQQIANELLTVIDR